MKRNRILRSIWGDVRTLGASFFLLFVVILLSNELSGALGEEEYDLRIEMAILVIPDTQYYVEFRRQILETMLDWCFNCYLSLDIKAIIQVGDVVHTPQNVAAFEYGKSQLQRLHALPIAHSVAAGNHDGIGLNDNFETYFSTQAHQYLNIVPQTEGQYRNHYFVKRIKQTDWMFIQLEFLPSTASFDWLRNVLDANRDKPTIITSHYMVDDCSQQIVSQFESIGNEFCQVKLMLGGHVFGCGGEAHLVKPNVCGSYYAAVAQNYQHLEHGGQGTVRLYALEANDNYHAFTIHTSNNTFRTQPSSQFSFNLQSGETVDSITPKQCTSMHLSGDHILYSFSAVQLTIILLFLAFLYSQ